MEIKGNKATLSFDYADDGLMVKGPSVTHLYIAGNDKIFYPAQSKISGNKLIVWSDKVSAPVAVRFAFSNTAVANLFSKSGLPVTPFRSDDWNINTEPVR
jgi:sialate O-acetylesterase